MKTTEPVYDSSPSKLSWRSEKFELMLRVAHANLFPYVVVRSQDFKDLAPNIRLTVIGGVIGEVLAIKALHEQVADGFRPAEFHGISDEEWREMESDGQELLIQDWLLSLEVAAEIDHNPISNALSELSAELGYPSCRYRPLEHKWTASLSREERREKWSSRPMIGAECTIHLQDAEPVTRRFWMTKFGIPGFSGVSLTKDPTELIALAVLRHQLGEPRQVR